MRLRFLFLVPLLASCSVFMAAKTEGCSLETVMAAQTRDDLLDLAGDPVFTELSDQGERVEVYRIMQEKGSTARAIMHGLLDLGSAFLWEFAGTPIESSLSEEKYYSVKATLDAYGSIQRMELQ